MAISIFYGFPILCADLGGSPEPREPIPFLCRGGRWERPSKVNKSMSTKIFALATLLFANSCLMGFFVNTDSQSPTFRKTDGTPFASWVYSEEGFSSPRSIHSQIAHVGNRTQSSTVVRAHRPRGTYHAYVLKTFSTFLLRKQVDESILLKIREVNVWLLFRILVQNLKPRTIEDFLQPDEALCFLL